MDAVEPVCSLFRLFHGLFAWLGGREGFEFLFWRDFGELVGRESLPATGASPPASDSEAVGIAEFSGVNDFRIGGFAVRASHFLNQCLKCALPLHQSLVRDISKCPFFL